MFAPILMTKLHIPTPRPAWVARQRLIERLKVGLAPGCKLTLISAPAGFGKTTLISAWIHAGVESRKYGVGDSPSASCSVLPTPRFAWLSLDEGDNDPARFLMYLVAALQTAAAEIGASVLPALQSPQPPPIEALLTPLLNEIAAIPGRFILVLDDYHVVEAPPVNAILAFLLEHLPPQLHLVIATREDPTLSLARLRARGQLAEVRAADLRFTPAEAADFLNRVMGLALSEAHVAALEARTEGWIAGLQLAALAMQGRPDSARFVASFTGSHRFVLDYLLEEVLHKQPEAIQYFLLRTAILDRLCGPLCDAVLDAPAVPGQETLAALDRANLFLVPLDDERHWYRYHRLFRDLLRQRLEQSLTREALAAHHLRASVWYAEHGDRAEAFRHAIAAGDFARAADLAEAAWPATFRSYVQNTLFLDWMKALPDSLIRARPVLSAGYAWALLDVGALEAAEAWLQDAERGLAATIDATAETGRPTATPVVVAPVVVDQEEFRALPATITIARAYLTLARGDGAAAVRLARQALTLIPETDYFRRAGIMALLGLEYLSSGDLDAAAAAMVEGMELTHAAGSVAIALTGAFPLAGIRLVQGRLHEAERVYARALQFATACDEACVPGLADLHLGLSQVYLERGDMDIAGQHLHKGMELDVQARSPDWAYRACLVRARLQEAVGDLDGALDLYQQAERLYHSVLLPDLQPLVALKARVWARQGRLAEALAWAQEQGLSAADELSFLREFEHITLARVLLARYRCDRSESALIEALDLLARLRQAAETGHRLGNAIEILILQALAHQARGDVSLALPPLERALTLAAPEGYVSIFADEGAPMAHLLSEAATRGSAPDYVARLLAACPNVATVSAKPSGICPPESGMIEPLSQREMEVLHLIAQGLSNREIGAKLFLALDTVKGHTRRIYGKLQVQRRTEAVARARALGLL